ncbi:MAG TPA: O-antigen ligase family protein [Oscillatoriaceae cyanobacterium]
MSVSATGWLARVGLADREESLGAALGRSRLVGAVWGAGLWLHDRLRPAIATSVVAKLAEPLSVAAVALVCVSLPYVHTGVNAALVLIAFALTLLRLFVQPDTRARFSNLDLCVLAFAAMHLVATGFSPFLMASVKGLAKMVIFWMGYFSFRQTLQTRRARTVVLAALFLGVTAESMYGIYQWKIHVPPLGTWEDPNDVDPVTRVYGHLLNPNLLAGYVLPAIPLAVTALLTWRRALKVLALATLATAPLCLWFTYSRGAFLAIIATAVCYLALGVVLNWSRIKESKPALYTLFGGVTAAVIGVAGRIATNHSVRERVVSIFTLRGDSSNSFRMNVWTGVFRMLHDYWVFGIGVGNVAFRHMYPLYMMSGFEALGAYNVFLEVFTELGIFGLLVFVWLLLSFLARTLYTVFTAEGENRWWAIALLAALVGTGVMGMFDTVFYRPAIQLQFWLLLALVIAVSPRREQVQ